MGSSQISVPAFAISPRFRNMARLEQQCTPNAITTVDCNTCWCPAKGAPVCTEMDCALVPKKMWGTMPVKKRKRRAVLLIGKALLLGVTGGGLIGAIVLGLFLLGGAILVVFVVPFLKSILFDNCNPDCLSGNSNCENYCN